jgi:hypothetical protein
VPGGIGRAVAMGGGGRGRSVIVNDYGVSIDGNEHERAADAVVGRSPTPVVGPRERSR